MHCALFTCQHMWMMSAFAAMRGDRVAMRPFAKILWTLVELLVHIVRMYSVRVMLEHAVRVCVVG